MVIYILADSHNILNRWNKYFCQLLNLHDTNTIRHIGRQAAEPLIPEPKSFEVEIAIEKPKRH
jgi:hypothetical protein